MQYMVKRKGLDFTEYGLVDARAAKRQRLNTDSNDPKWVAKAWFAHSAFLSLNTCSDHMFVNIVKLH